jgi:DHA1 family tetracycline resistance protein-like MFS transporter
LKRKLGLFDRRLLTILLIVFVQMVGTSMVHPILPLYAQSVFHLDAQVISLLITAFFAAQFLAGPFIGRLSDQRGRLPVLLISQIGTVIAFLMLGFAQSAAVLFVARILDGVTGGNIVVAQAYVTDIMPERRRTEALGYTMAAFGLGFIIGPAAGGMLASRFGPHVPFLFAAAAAFITVILTWLTLEESLSHADKARNRDDERARLRPAAMLKNVALISVLTISFMSRFGMGLLIGVFALFAEAVLFVGQDFATVSLGVGLMLMVVGIGQFLTQIFVLPATLKRFSDPPIVVLGVVARAISMFMLAIATEPMLGTISVAVFALGSGLLFPPLQSLLTKTVAKELRGSVLGLNQSAMNLGVILSTAVAGTIFALNPALPNLLGGILYCLALLPSLFLWNWTRNGVALSDKRLAVTSQ